jgi:hypothetical protein
MHRKISIYCFAGWIPFIALLVLSVLFVNFEFAWASSEKPSAESNQCVWIFHSYESSAWEKEWIAGEETGIRTDLECEVLSERAEAERSERLIKAVASIVLDASPSIPPDSIDLFSRMIYARHCGPDKVDTGARRVQLIEPLVGILRDPLSICPRPRSITPETSETFGPLENSVQSKRHLLPAPLAPWSDTPKNVKSWRVDGSAPWTSGTPSRQNILIDIGASLYGGWNSDSTAVGAAWFVERFKRHHLAFDWIISYEIEKHDPDEIFKDVPDDVLPHYLYFNQGVVAEPGARWNPWRILKDMSISNQDYVALKLDIDVPDIEGRLIEQLMNDDTLSQRVDEVFFEHHVNVSAMRGFWGVVSQPITMKDSYRLFLALRRKGIRMHSWP